MIGSLRALWPWQDADRVLEMPAPGTAIVGIVALAIGGFLFVTLVERIGARRSQHS